VAHKFLDSQPWWVLSEIFSSTRPFLPSFSVVLLFQALFVGFLGKGGYSNCYLRTISTSDCLEGITVANADLFLRYDLEDQRWAVRKTGQNISSREGGIVRLLI
jgi:hypothetical protein